MGQLTTSSLIKALTSLFSSLDDTDRNLVKRTLGPQFKKQVRLTDGGTAGTAQTATPAYSNDEPNSETVTLKACTVITPVTLAADAANKLTFTVDRVDATGANAVSMGTWTSDVAGGGATAFVPKVVVPITASAASDIPNGWTVRVAVSKAGTGVAFASATAQAIAELTFEKDV